VDTNAILKPSHDLPRGNNFMRLTVSNVRSLTLPAGKNEALVFDDDLPGFGLRLRAGGSRTWIFQYAIAGKQRRLTIGKTSAIDFTKAKDTAKNLYAQVRLGGDPAGEKAAAKVHTGETFQAAARAFLERQRGRVRP
jgi:Arm domain-containing DNA-binding protein